MTQQFKEYSDALASCMATYQFIEESLKFCLYRCHAIVRFRLYGVLSYSIPFNAIDNAALGRLIDYYKVFTENENLINNLRLLKKHRDHCAHKGYLLTEDEQDDDALLQDRKEELQEFHNKADLCMRDLKVEMETVEKLVEGVYAKLRTEQENLADALTRGG